VTYALGCFPLRTVAFRGHFPKDMPFNYRKWNILAFRGWLMSLLAPARGMSTLPAKGGFSRPSSFTHFGVSPRPHLPQESRIFHLLGQFIPRLNKIQCAGQLIGTESVRMQWKSTVLAHIQRIQIYVQIYILCQKGF